MLLASGCHLLRQCGNTRSLLEWVRWWACLPIAAKLLAKAGTVQRSMALLALAPPCWFSGVSAFHIAILGLGYVGTTTAACLAKAGHHVLGVDINLDKVAAIGAGRSPVVEPMVEELLSAGVSEGRVKSAVAIDGDLDRLDMVIICVGTPSRGDGKLDLSHLLESTRQLGQALRQRRAAEPLLLVFRSTMPPGTMDRLVLPTLERAAGEPPGKRYEVAFNPEFLREATAVKDYFAPPKIVVGEREPGITKRLLGIYDGIDAPFFEVPFPVAEMGKFVDNSWHAVKVAFANEIGRVSTARGIDPQAVADIFLSDTKLNVSAYYLRPGGRSAAPACPRTCPACWRWRATPACRCRCWPAAARATRCTWPGWRRRCGPRWRPPGRCCSWGCRSSRARTICATAHCSTWPRSWSRPATIWRSTTPTSTRRAWSASTSPSPPSTRRR